MAISPKKTSGFALDCRIPTKLPNTTTEKRLITYLNSDYQSLISESRLAYYDRQPLRFNQTVTSIGSGRRGALSQYSEECSHQAFDLIIEVLGHDYWKVNIACYVGHPELWRIDPKYKIEFFRCEEYYMCRESLQNRALPKSYDLRTGRYSIPFALADKLNPALAELHARLNQLKAEYESAKFK